MLLPPPRALRLLRSWIWDCEVNAMVSASMAWCRWSLRFVQFFIWPTWCPSLLRYDSVSPSWWYLSQLSSFITSTNCQSSLNLIVIEPVVTITVRVISWSISFAFFAIYCESLKSRLRKSEGISFSSISKFFSFLGLVCLNALITLSLYCAKSAGYFHITKSRAVMSAFCKLASWVSMVLLLNESSKSLACGMMCSTSKSLENRRSMGTLVLV